MPPAPLPARVPAPAVEPAPLPLGEEAVPVPLAAPATEARPTRAPACADEVPHRAAVPDAVRQAQPAATMEAPVAERVVQAAPAGREAPGARLAPAPATEQATAPGGAQVPNAAAAAPDDAVHTRRCPVPRVASRHEADLRRVLEAGAPVLVTDAAPHLSGHRVLDFMPKLMSCAGKLHVSYEVQGPQDEVRVQQSPLAMYIQDIQRSTPGRAFMMMSDDVLCRPDLSEFVLPPSCCEPDLLPSLPSELQPSCRRTLLMGGKGAASQLHRDPVTCCGWHLLVLGKARWRLFPPGTEPAELGAELGSWGSGASLASSFSEDAAARCPGWGPEEVWEATQEMGEVLLIPTGWWHQLLLEDRSLAVIGHFVTETLMPLVAHEVALWLSSQATPEEPPADEREVFELAAAQARIHGRPDLRAWLRCRGFGRIGVAPDPGTR